MNAIAWGSIGLCLNMAGVVLAWLFGLPQPSHEEGVGLGLEDGTLLPNGKTVLENNREVSARRARYRRFSCTGLVLMFLGFLFQLVALWVTPPPA